jgi:hypothetical protein
MTTVREFDARYNGQSKLIEQLEQVKDAIGADDALAIKRMDAVLEYLHPARRRVLVGYSRDYDEFEQESVSDGEAQGEAIVDAMEQYRIDKADGLY